MLDQTQYQLRRTSQLLVGFCVVIFFVWFTASQFASAAQSGKNSVKKTELKQLEKALFLSEISYGVYPENRNEPGWCVIGKFYGFRACLSELTRDGFTESLPVSPDEHPYLYNQIDQNAYLAVVLTDYNGIPREDLCSIDGVVAWCLKVVK